MRSLATTMRARLEALWAAGYSCVATTGIQFDTHAAPASSSNPKPEAGI